MLATTETRDDARDSMEKKQAIFAERVEWAGVAEMRDTYSATRYVEYQPQDRWLSIMCDQLAIVLAHEVVIGLLVEDLRTAVMVSSLLTEWKD